MEITKSNNLQSIISIIVPVFNVDKYLNACVDSIINQTFNRWELILINDNSTDESGNICDHYSNDYPTQIRTIHNKRNIGQAACRNIGMSNSSGKYILFVDSDDWLLMSCCEKLFNLAESNNADICRCRIRRYYEHLKVFEPFKVYKNNIESWTHLTKSDYYHTLSIPDVGGCWGILYQASYLKRYNLRFNENIRFCEDTPFGITSSLKATRLVVLKEPLYCYRIRSFSTMSGHLISERGLSSIAIFSELIQLNDYLKSNFPAHMILQQALETLVIVFGRLKGDVRKTYFAASRPYFLSFRNLYSMENPKQTIPLFQKIIRSYRYLASLAMTLDSPKLLTISCKIKMLMQNVNSYIKCLNANKQRNFLKSPIPRSKPQGKSAIDLVKSK